MYADDESPTNCCAGGRVIAFPYRRQANAHMWGWLDGWVACIAHSTQGPWWRAAEENKGNTDNRRWPRYYF